MKSSRPVLDYNKVTQQNINEISRKKQEVLKTEFFELVVQSDPLA